MKNSIIIPKMFKEYSKINIRDYTSLNIDKIKNMSIFNNEKYITYITLENNMTFEYVSQTLYGTPDYWDLIMIINDIDIIEGLPKDYDTICEYTEKQINYYMNKSDYYGPYQPGLKNYLYNKQLQKNIYKNEQIRKIKVLKKQYIEEALSTIREKEIFWW